MFDYYILQVSQLTLDVILFQSSQRHRLTCNTSCLREYEYFSFYQITSGGFSAGGRQEFPRLPTIPTIPLPYLQLIFIQNNLFHTNWLRIKVESQRPFPVISYQDHQQNQFKHQFCGFTLNFVGPRIQSQQLQIKRRVKWKSWLLQILLLL